MWAIARCRIGRLLDELLLRLLFGKYDDVVWKGEFPLSPKFIYWTANFSDFKWTYDIVYEIYLMLIATFAVFDSPIDMFDFISEIVRLFPSKWMLVWKILWNFRKKIQRTKFSKNSNLKIKLSEKIEKWNYCKKSKFKTSTWKKYVFGWTSHSTYVISLSP